MQPGLQKARRTAFHRRLLFECVCLFSCSFFSLFLTFLFCLRMEGANSYKRIIPNETQSGTRLCTHGFVQGLSAVRTWLRDIRSRVLLGIPATKARPIFQLSSFELLVQVFSPSIRLGWEYQALVPCARRWRRSLPARVQIFAMLLGQRLVALFPATRVVVVSRITCPPWW